jgi:hypothetical protein
MQTTKMAPIAINVRQPVGTNHFQFRDHQFFRGGCEGNGDGVEGMGGGVDSIASFWRPAKSKSSNLVLDVMKPTAPSRYKVSVFATTPSRGLSLSR